MIVICAWCQAGQGTKEPLENTTITHGICPECFKEMTKEVENTTLPASMNDEFFDAFYEELGVKNPRSLRTQNLVV